MNYKMLWLRFILAYLICSLLAGCVSTKYVEHKQYLLDVPAVQTGKKAQRSYTIFVNRVEAIAPFDQLDFLYRVKSGYYLSDYYHGFLVPPSEQLDEIVSAYFRTHGIELTASQNRLNIKLTEFYADYRDRNNPKAVITMRFILSKLIDNKVVILVDKTLRSAITLKAKNTENLLYGWNKGIKDIMERLVQVLNRT
ncbi:MAG: hypothetical protein LBL17_01975 [Coxiellaceae bacterium]|jgi:uncharacterized lipoprotein YmbA|nr:hypothetical protein [Coxiellaceae bacterium]